MRELLILLCQYPYRDENREPLRNQLSRVADWHKLVDLINAHGIIALAAYNIKESGLMKEVPPDAMASLENGYKQSMVRNLWLAERWKEVNAILNNAGIKHVLLKGMVLEHTLYGSKGLRQMTDNDILIKKEDSIRAWNILIQNGYNPDIVKSSLHKRIMFHIGKHLPTLIKDGFEIEIHHTLFDTDNGYHFDNSGEIFIRGTKGYTLPEELHLKYLKKHYERHTMQGDCQLRLYIDIKLLDKNTSIEIKDNFIENPIQSSKKRYQRNAYRIEFKSVATKYKIPFIIGDIFPSLTWMKRRYKCGAVKAMLYYPQRIGKLTWLI